jgi:hypothetical protein
LHVCPAGHFETRVSWQAGFRPHFRLPTSQAGVGVQAVPATQAVHLPARHAGGLLPAPQEVPSARTEVAVQTWVPVAQEYAAVRTQGSVRVHAAPAVQAMQAPDELQTWFVPQAVPAGLEVRVVHTGDPLEHSNVAVAAQGSVEVQAAPWVQATQAPAALQTWFVPQDVPAGLDVRVVHTAVPLEHS